MLALLAALAVATPAPPACAFDKPAMMALSFEAFDQGKDGWRKIAAMPGCFVAAAELIAAYRQANAGQIAPERQDGLSWHEGQMWAAAGDYPRAIQAFQPSLNDPHPGDRAYGEATLAFVRRDRPGLLAARDKLARVPAPPNFAETAAKFQATYGQTIAWPPNLDVVDGLIACFDKPYAEAYSGKCRPKPAAAPTAAREGTL